jgi:hypothetical protein
MAVNVQITCKGQKLRNGTLHVKLESFLKQGSSRSDSHMHAHTLLPEALASVPFGFVLVRVRVRLLILSKSSFD